MASNTESETDAIGFNQLEFIAQEEKVQIVPNFSSGRIAMLTGECGPFEPLTPVEVPLWVACQFKKMKKCSITPPEWMTYGMFTYNIC